MLGRLHLCRLFACLFLAAPSLALADAAPFDLSGPTLEVTVTHGAITLPISQVPNLSVGDQLEIKADLPPAQSVHYLLVAGFLRGATNPPPTTWFHKAQTWDHKAGADVLKMTVPADAQQVILFLAPQTGGDFATLVSAVRGRPGAFVRASQDLNQASLDRSRLDAYLASIRKADRGDPDHLKTVTPLLARSLSIKLNADCFDKMADLQAACLTQGQDALVLNDGHSASIVESLTSGSSADLAFQLSATPHADFGLYSPYVAAVMDIAKIMDSFRTAKYAYIPALGTADGGKLALLLNTAPSFHDQLSVLVASLPAIGPPQAPPLQPVDPKGVYCAQRGDLVLAVEGAPLAYSTDYAHAMALRLKTKTGETLELPAKADAEAGGFVIDTRGFDAAKVDDQTDAVLHGVWGFAPFDGPTFQLQSSHAEAWRVSEGDDQALVVGRDDTLHLDGREATCVESVSLSGGAPLDWKAAQPDQLSVTVPLVGVSPGPVTLLIKQYGMAEPQAVTLKAFAESGRVQSFTLHAGDTSGVLAGARLDQVSGLTLAGVAFKPGVMTSVGGGDELTLDMADPAGGQKLSAGQTFTAKVALGDGRSQSLKVTVAGPSPSVALIGKSVQPGEPTQPIPIRLTGADELRQGAVMTFSVRALQPSRFSSDESIEVATIDGGASAKLTQQSGLTLEDAHVALATLDTGKAFGGSAFGPLRFRIVTSDGPGVWQPLATLVRTPVLRELKCDAGPERPCELSGSNLFLIDSVASDPAFAHVVKTPEGFPGYVLSVPHPIGGRLYIRLRDDPGVVNEAVAPAGRELSRR